MRRLFVAVLAVSTLLGLCGCAKEVNLSRLGITVAIPAAFSQIYAGSAPVTLTASLDDDPANGGIIWRLSQANTSCSPACGILTKSTTDPKFSIVYTPPAVPPRNVTATITAVSADDHAAAFVFNFTILAPISVSIVNKFTTQTSGDPSVVLNATVTNDLSNLGLNWSLSANGQPCPVTCGTLTFPSSPPSATLTATYTPPATAPTGANATPTITATSVTDPTKSDSFMFTIVPGITVTITNPFKTQHFGDPSVTINASVDNDAANAGVTWTLLHQDGTPCSNCGTLVAVPAPPSPSFSANYTPPTTQPLGPDANPVITAQSVTNPTKTDSFSFTISIGTAPFAGSYAFLLRGFDVLSSPMSMAGSVTFDSNGAVIAGDLDINNGGGITFISQLSGTFMVDSSFNGTNRGTINITSGVLPGSSTPVSLQIPYSFRFDLSTDRNHGRILELDGNSFLNVGIFQLQDPSALSAANPAGTYVFGFDSDSPPGGRTVEVGRFVLGSSGITSGMVDESRAGAPFPRYSAAPLATGGAFTPPDSSGRGTLTVSVAATATVPAASNNYAYYILNSEQLNFIQIDHTPSFGTVYAGVARIQKPLDLNSVVTTSVLQVTGMDAVPGSASNQAGPDVIIGVAKIAAIPNMPSYSFNLTFDENDLGTTIFTAKPTAGFLIFDPTTGRGAITVPGGFGVGFMDSSVFYLNDVGQGFIIDADISTCVPGGPVCPGGVPPNNYPITNNAFSGTFTPQVAGPFSNQTLSGNLIFSSGASAISAIPNVDAGVTFNASAGTYNAKGDLTSLDSQAGLQPDITFNGTYNVNDAGLGHVLVRLPQQFFGVFGANQPIFSLGYIIGPNQVVVIGIQSGVFSGVLFFDPQ
ncbi:MAG TPA: hypothetical protein VFN26_13820 [Candidatus Acidoferrum sp.]|nr:hypothetical protein [Candidatus Acidoferrum sp.]